ncbi:hypothetical protein KEJ39_00110 [Candidatus Bathyarchaeota archaeon]|nr:hypothetical protein [Candidatus Bathyarchaeota archaeon]
MSKEDFASTLGGAERFGKPILLRGGAGVKVNFMVTGASTINYDGIRYGKGHGFLILSGRCPRRSGQLVKRRR